MGNESIDTHTVKTSSDGTVKLALEVYNELLEKAATKPPVINRTTVIKTAEMVAQEHRVWGGMAMGLGVCLFAIGAVRFKLGSSE